jgi:hypothetical protein
MEQKQVQLIMHKVCLKYIKKTIIATKIPRLVTREIREDGAQVERTRRTTENELVKWYDPLAQTFTINHEVAPDGIFARSLDLFFSAKDAALPINVSIRSVENGYPTQSVLPGAEKWVYPTDINTHATGNTATTITWDHPVFLDSGQEYAIVLMANSDVYKVWVSEMGAFDIADQQKELLNNHIMVYSLLLQTLQLGQQNKRKILNLLLIDVNFQVIKQK